MTGVRAPADRRFRRVHVKPGRKRGQIAAMLRYTSGNRRKAAQLLGLARSTLLAKIRRYGLEAPAESEA